MAMHNKGYDLYILTPMRNSAHKIVDSTWLTRTSGKRETTLEMAEALAADLTHIGVSWQIRDSEDKVVQERLESTRLH